MPKFILGLTGGIGSGKSTAARYFAELGAHIIEADAIARQFLAPGQPLLKELAKKFGSDLFEENILNRNRLRKLIFKNEEARLWLEAKLHPLILKEIQRKTQSNQTYTVWVIPLLFEKGLQTQVDRTLVIDATVELQRQRTLTRDKMMLSADFDDILQIQWTREQRIQLANDVIFNSGSLHQLKAEVEKFHYLYLEIAHELTQNY